MRLWFICDAWRYTNLFWLIDLVGVSHFTKYCTNRLLIVSSSRMRVMNHNWSATKQHLHPQSVAEISCHSVLSGDTGQDSTMWDIVWVSPQGHRSVSVSRHFLLQAPQCPCSMQKQFSRDHCCRGRSKPGYQIVGSHTRWEWPPDCMRKLTNVQKFNIPQWWRKWKSDPEFTRRSTSPPKVNHF